MQIPPFVRRTAAAFLAAAGGACVSGTVDPSSIAGTYVLRSIAGDALPTYVSTGFSAGGPRAVLADTIRLRADGTGTRTTVTGADIENHASMGDGRSVFPLGANVVGRRLELFYACGPTANCLGIGPAHLTTTGFEIAATEFERGPQAYRRISRSP